MPDSKILTLHPTSGKTGRNINRQTYDLFKAALLDILRGQELNHNQLFEQLNQNLQGKFAGNIGWYGETIKLDLEARGLIQRTNSKPQKYRLK